MPTKRPLRWMFIGGAALLVVLVVLLLVPLLVPVDRFRPVIVRLAEDNIGRKVEVEALRLRLLPDVHLQIVNLRIKNPTGFPAGDMLAIKSADVSTTLTSLLTRRLDVQRVSLHGVQINVLRTAAGQTNYDFPGRLGSLGGVSRTGGQTTRAAPAVALNQVVSVNGRQIKITSGIYEPATGHVVPQFEVDGLNVRIGDIHVGAPTWTDTVTVAADLRGVAFSSPILSQPLRIREGSVRIAAGAAASSFSAALDTLRADGAVKIANFNDPVADFDISVPALDLDKFKTLVTGGTAGQTLTAGLGGPRRLLARGRIRIGTVTDRPIEASSVVGQVALFTDRAEINGYSLSAFGGTVRGVGLVDYAAARQPVQVSAQLRDVDVADAVKAAAVAVPPGIAGKLNADVRLTTALTPDLLAALKVTVDSYTLTAAQGTVRGTAVLDYAAGRQQAAATFRARGLGLAEAIRVLAIPVQPGIDGTLDADGRVAAALGHDPLSTATAAGTYALRDGRVPGLSKPLQIQSGTFSARRDALQGTFAATLDTLAAQGAVSVTNLKNPSVDFDVTVPDLDLDRIRTLGAGGGGEMGGAGQSGGSRRLVARGAIRIGRLRARPLEANAVTGRVNIYTDRVTVDSYTLSAYGGTARGTAAVEYAAPRSPAQGMAQISGVDVRRLLAALSPGAQRITGTLEGTGRLTTMLTPDPLAALAGAGTFAVRNGSLPGLDLGKTLGGMAKVAPAGGSGGTRFRYFGGDFRIAQRRVYSDGLKMDADALQATGRGSAGFDGTLSYSGSGTVKGFLLSKPQGQFGNVPFLGNALPGPGAGIPSLGEYTARVPFAIAGTFGNPKFSATGVPQISRTVTPAQPPTPQPQQPPGPNPIKLPPLPFGL